MSLGPSPFGTNALGVSVKPLDFTAAGAPTTMVWHATSIVVNGNLIGRITEWNPSAYNRENTLVYELSHLTWGRPVDRIPGISTGYTISFARAEVWSQELEVALGLTGVGDVFDDLADQDRPFTVLEYLFKGVNLYRIWAYEGVWLTQANRNSRTAEGNGMITIEGGEMAYVSRKRLV